MRKTRLSVFPILILAIGMAGQPSLAQQGTAVELNTLLMQSTFLIQGGDQAGTAFVLGRPVRNDPLKARYVMITAAHVLQGIPGEQAILHVRVEQGGSQWNRVPVPIKIRDRGHELWTKHPAADVAVMYVGLPKEVVIPLVSTNLFADDARLSAFEIHPGDEVNSLGYPLGEASNPAGFPILRSGKIASYPLLPTRETRTFLMDFRVFKGNSGGPVYLVQSSRTYGSGVRLGQTVALLLGLVSGERLQAQQVVGPYSAELRELQLGLAVVVHASLIIEAINLLPPPDEILK
jgi:hypothetical protein